MIFFVGNDGTIFKSEAEGVYQGSAGANNIYLYAPFAANLTCQVAFTLPNGKITDLALMTATNALESGNGDIINNKTGVSYAGWKYTLPNEITQYYGEVTAQFYFMTAQGKIVATSATSFKVLRGVQAQLPDPDDPDIYNQILAALSQIQLDLANGYFAASGLLEYNSEYAYKLNELVWYPVSGELGRVLRSLADNNNAPPYDAQGNLSENWSVVIDFQQIYDDTQSAIAVLDEAKKYAEAAQNSAQNARQSAAEAYLYLQKIMAEATDIFYLAKKHNAPAIATSDFEPQPLEEAGNTIIAVTEDGFICKYIFAEGARYWTILESSGGGFTPIDLNGAGIENIARSGTTPTGDAVYTITLTNNEKYNFTAPKGDKGDRGDSLVITEWYDSFDALNADFETTSVPNGQYAAIKYTLDYYQKGESAWIYLGNLRFVAGDIALNIDDECRPYATFNNTSDYSVDDLKNDILNGEVIVAHAVNADNLGNLAASQYYSTQNKPTAEDVGLGKTLTITLDLDDESVVSFDGSEDKSITIDQSYFHAIMIEFLSNGGGDNWRGYITVYIVLPNVAKQNNQLSLGNRIYAMGCTSADNFYPCTGEINPDLENTTYSVNGIFCTEENKGLSVVYSKTLSHYFGENTTRTAIDVVTPILNINNN